MSILKKFQEDSLCFKCGGIDIGTFYCKSYKCCAYCSLNDLDVVGREIMHRECNRCKHSWNERPIDYKGD